MKRCPACHKEYDDATIYCETDGTALEASGHKPNNQSLMLADFIARHAPLEIDRAVRVAIAICQAVEELERAGRAVSALYPRAIRIQSHGQIDEIRLSKVPIEPIGGGQMHDEREAYLSPEAAQQQPTNAASAVYSIGTMLYEMLTGQPPFTVTTDAAIRVKHILEPPRPPTSLRPEIPLPVQEVLLRALEKDNGSRQRSPAQLQRELEAALVPEPLVPAPPSLDLASITLPPPASYRPPSAPLQAPPLKRGGKSAPSATPMTERALKADLEPPPAAAAQPTEMAESASIAASPPMLTCPNCGHRNNLGDRFCAVCGGILAIAQTMVLASVAPSAAARLHLIMASGEAGDIYELSDETVIGRASGDLLFPHDNYLSGRHARIERRGDRYILIDEESRNGTFIKITDEVQLQTDDRILIGKQLFRAEIESPEPAVEIESPEPAPTGDDDDTPTVVRPKRLPPTLIEVTPAPEPPVVDEPQSVAEEKQCPDCGRRYPTDHLYCEYDGQPLQLSEPDAPLEEIGPFTIGQYHCFARLGEGGMGVVYKARHQHLDRLSAVKVLLPETAHLPEAVNRFRREAQIASSINHPNSVVIYDYGEVSASLFYLAMEFIAGKSLAQILKPKRQPLPLPLARTLSITRQICDVLDAAHQVGIIHRDLKPHNVMICERAGKPDLVKVVDFGLARSLGHRSDSLPGVVVGTPAFMSPEQARGEMNIDARTDIFSLALMVYRMLSGALPFPAEGLDLWSQVMRRAKLVEPPPPLSFLRPELRIPAEVDAVLALALAPNRNERTPTAALFIEQLEKAARG